MMNYLVRKDAVPPKTETIKKFKNGGSLNELGERLEDMYDLYDNDKPLSASRENIYVKNISQNHLTITIGIVSRLTRTNKEK